MIHLSHLETNVTSLCQLRCIACNHFVPIDQPWSADPDQIARDLEHLARFVRVAGYALIGGEPLLHKDLVAILAIAKRSGISDRIEIWTNGLRLLQQPPEFWELQPTIILSAYPHEMTDDLLAAIHQKAGREGVTIEVRDERHHPNFSQLLASDQQGPRQVLERFTACWFRTYSRVVDRGFFYTCCTSPYIPRLLLKQPEGTDGIAVDATLTEQRLLAFLARSQPLSSCRVCAGRHTDAAYPIPWRQIREPQAWLDASGGSRL